MDIFLDQEEVHQMAKLCFVLFKIFVTQAIGRRLLLKTDIINCWYSNN